MGFACVLIAMFGFAGTASAQDPLVPEAPVETPDVEATLAEIQALLADVQGDPAGAVATLQAYATGKVGDATAQGLPLALSLLTKVSEPVCPTVGTVSNLLPITLGLNYTGFVPSLDSTTSELLYQYYKTVFGTLVNPLTVPPPLAPGQSYVSLAQALLGLLKVNWHTVYYPPGGGAPVVRDTPALLDLPMILDVDGQVGPGGYELCATMTFDLATGNITQQIARMPLARASLPVDVKSEFLGGVIAPGYEAPNAPYVYSTALGLAGTPVSTKTTTAGPALTQTFNLTSALQYRYASKGPVPSNYVFTSTHPGKDTSQPTSQQAKGNKVSYYASAVGGGFDYTLKLGTLNLGVGMTPAPTAFKWCTSTKGYCSNEPATNPELATTSTSLLASQPVRVDQHALSAVPGACTAFASPASDSVQLGDSHITGSQFFLSARPAAGGVAWLDTNGTGVTGCLATSSVTGNLPSGFRSVDRRATWGAGFVPPPLTKTGTIVCPMGGTAATNTAITGGSFGLVFGLSRYLCTFPPVNLTLPTITGATALKTATNGTWTPSGATNPNTPLFTKQWLRCDAAGAACVAIAGATATTYTATAADSGKTLRVLVTATNFDGTAQATSLQTAVQP